MGSLLISDAMKHASFNIIFQISTRILTFLLNAFILHYVRPYTLGVINVRLLLLYTTTQFISREPMRRVCISEAKSHPWTSLVNLVWLNVPISLLLGYTLSYIWLNWLQQPDPDQASGYRFAVLLMPIIVSIELISESMFIQCQLKNLVKVRINIEAAALILRCCLMAYFVHKDPANAVIIFIYSLLASSLLLTILYHIYFAVRINDTGLQYRQYFPHLKRKNFLAKDLVKLNLSFFSQTVIKQFLTEGEKFIMTFLNPLTFAEQGIFDVVNNLGSLAARFIFQPIEESAYILFGKLVVRGTQAKQDRSKYKMAIEALNDLLKLMSIIGLVIFVFGFNYSQLALRIYNKENLGHGLAITLMRWHCFYIFLIAINGVSEAFTFVAMSKEEIDRFNVWLVTFSILFLTVASLATTFIGAPGLILANCVNMICRIAFSIKFINGCKSRGKQENLLESMIPHRKVLTACSVIFGLTRLSETCLCCEDTTNAIIHLLFGAGLFFLIVLIIYRNEPSAIKIMNQIPIFRFLFRFISKSKTK